MRSLNGLGMVAKYTGQWGAGRRHYSHALVLLGGGRPASGPLAATVLHNLAGLEHAAGRYARAEALARRGIAVRKKAERGPTVPLATDLAALAAILHSRGALEEAAPLYRRAIGILERRLGRRHPEVRFAVRQWRAIPGRTGRFLG